MAGKKQDFGLTEKQLKFATGAVSGLSLADAYRNAYDAGNMSDRAIRTESARLAARPDIARAMEAIAGEKKAKMQVVSVSDRDMLISNLRNWTKGLETPTSAQLRAAELLGKACGLYRDIVETRTDRPAAEVLADLERRLDARLAELGQGDDPSAGEEPSAGEDARVH
jgi:hypothetical protein